MYQYKDKRPELNKFVLWWMPNTYDPGGRWECASLEPFGVNLYGHGSTDLMWTSWGDEYDSPSPDDWWMDMPEGPKVE